MLEGIRVRHRTAYDKMCPAGHIAGIATYVIVVDCNRHRNTQLSQSSLGIPLLIQISAFLLYHRLKMSMASLKGLVDLDQGMFWLSAASIVFNPTYWK